jgi:competence protein ComEC
VFPHHGGLPEGARTDGSAAAFATKLMGACRPSTVLFSIGRGAHATPQPSVVSAVRAADSSVHIACTQLSQRCSDDLLAGAQHLGARYAAGREAGSCCLGSAVLTPSIGLQTPSRDSHEQAVSLLPNRLCR